jgi:hypothetical protein
VLGHGTGGDGQGAGKVAEALVGAGCDGGWMS